jgi:hypothetical protein
MRSVPRKYFNTNPGVVVKAIPIVIGVVSGVHRNVYRHLHEMVAGSYQMILTHKETVMY